MPTDQAFKQNNAMVKWSGGAIRCTQNPSALRKWLLAGPEQAQLVDEFEEQFLIEQKWWPFYYDEGLSVQQVFMSFWWRLLMKCEIHFCINLMTTLNTGNVFDESVVETVHTIEQLGKEQFKDYNKSVLVDCTHSIQIYCY